MEALLFTVGGGVYLAPLSDLDEVLMPARLSPLARAPTFLTGVLNLRGANLPVLDLAERLGQIEDARWWQASEHRPWRRDHRILCFSAAGLALGAIVDRVTGIRSIAPDERREPVLSETGAPPFLGGLWPVEGHLTQEIRLRDLLAPAELALLRGINAESPA